jgi:hypothetical protein
MMLKRTAKSCRSDAPGLASSLRENAQATVTTKPGHRGEREVSRKTIARGMPGRSGVTVVTTLVCFFHLQRGCGRIERPAFPAPSDFLGGWFCKNSDASRREDTRSCLKIGAVIASEAKQSISPRGRNGLLRRGACHRARIRATRWLLAMTGPHGHRLEKFQIRKNLIPETASLTSRSSAQRRRGPIIQ